MMIDVTRTIDPGPLTPAGAGTVPADPAAAADLTDSIIADYRAFMGQMKCAMSDRLVRLGISMAQLNIMYTLERNGEMPMSRLADVLNVSLSNATGLIDRMEERGFIERTRVPEDRRIVLVRVTPAGNQVIEENDALSDELLRTVLRRLDADQLPVVARVMTEFRSAIEAATVPPLPDRHPLSTLAPRSR
jgi:DNA-binding MarR family transcriptional regulator